ncbi:MnhB domain-containing protein [Clostridium sp. DL1XJH146]
MKIRSLERKLVVGLFMIIIASLFIFLYYSEIELVAGGSRYYYLENAFKDTSSKNIVTSIYLDYRLYDTFFEALMLLVSVIGIIHFSRHDSDEHVEPIIEKGIISKEDSQIISVISVLLYPFILTFGIYIIVNGHKSPGGGFQGGAVLSALFIIRYLINPAQNINLYLLQRLEKFTFLFILLIGTLFIILGLNNEFAFLKESYLVLMNSLIGFKVFCGLSIIFIRFVFYESR